MANLLRYFDPAGTPPGRVDRLNRAVNPRAVDVGATSGWATSRFFGTGGGAGTYSYGVGISGPAGTGITTCRRKTWTAAPTSNGDTGFDIRPDTTNYFPCTPGETLTISTWMRAVSPAGSKAFRQSVQFYDRVAQSGAVAVGTTVTGLTGTSNSGAWTQITQTLIVPAGALGMRVISDATFGNTLWMAGDNLEATGLLIEKVAAVDTFFDGKTPSTTSFDYAWTGAVDISTSTATPWKTILPPKGATGPAGPAGAAYATPRPSAGGVGFYGSIAGYISGSGATLLANMKTMPGFTDRNPCLTIKDAQTLRVARAGTILIHFQGWVDRGNTVNSQSNFIQIGSPHIGRYNFPMSQEVRGSVSVVIPNAAIGFEIVFYWQGYFVDTAVNLFGSIYAALA